MNVSRYFPDVVQSIAAFVIGVAFALFLHSKWYSGGWMPLFGDPPDTNPAYNKFVPLFEIAPYVVGGLSVGLVAGFGYPQPLRILIRFLSVVILFLIASAHNFDLAISGFVKPAIGAFFVSTALSLAYFRLLALPPVILSSTPVPQSRNKSGRFRR